MANKPVKKKKRTKKLAPDKELARAAELPRTWSISCDSDVLTIPMTLRQWYAGQAMGAWLSSYPEDCAPDKVNAEDVSEFAFRIADAMLAAERTKANGRT